ncbi:methylmalonyl-CoA mutase [Lysinibacillus yapensis]|uniref:Methylmalonyl-CoA mutase n=1 Tax=Ureibacillus yapensis TaxID=2304605 RepID=A0A396SAQ2_9BACL|nr:methylmalonyl-CoA mutase family protein [Lysinibacillus yapensis]RHW38431.1 methylmalonyl-CoA mutase [Lysinibacillus yapensis]
MAFQMKDIQFPAVSYDEWKEQAVKALKGQPFQTLFTKTMENVILEPLYTKDMLLNKLDGQLDKQIATIRSSKAAEGIKVAQQIYGDTPAQFFTNLQASMDKGNQIITIDSRVPFKWDDENLTILAKYLTAYPFKLFTESSNDPVLKVFDHISDQEITGYIVSKEPIILDAFNHVRTLSANTVPYHYEDADAIQELALSLALASKHAEHEENFETFINKFFVHFAIDTQFFSEIAKLRAFKVLWKAFTSAYGIDAPVAIPVIAETSLRSYSKLDVYVNLLRAGNETFAALIGGADAITVHPHDCLSKPTDQSIRIARNVSLVLKEESFVEKVLDPAGGSYFIETLTAEYVEKAWNLFLLIEEAGGIDAYTASGQLKTALQEVNERRLHDVKTRKQSMIGTNIYANPVDELPLETNDLFSQIKRLAVPFEDLRISYKKANPKVEILTFGTLKDFKARADFVSGFFAVAGIVPSQSGEMHSIEELKEWVTKTDAEYVVIAAKEEDAKSIVPALLEVKPDSLLMDVAGQYKSEQDEWLAKGLNGFIYNGQDIIEKLTSLIESLKGVQQ